MTTTQDWSIVALKHRNYAFIEKGIVSQTLAKSRVTDIKKQPKYQNIYVREVKTGTVNNLEGLLTIEELLNLKS